MSSKRKKKKTTAVVKKTVENEKVSSLKEEIRSIKNKIKEEDKLIYNLNSDKRKTIEEIVDLIFLNSDMKALLNTYTTLDSQVQQKKLQQKNRKTDLANKENKLTEEEKACIEEEKVYKKIGDPDVNYPVGLYDTECKHPVAICNQKQVFLSYKDIRNKKCLKHRDKKPCHHLIWLNGDETLY